MIILGINAYHGDSSACLVRDGRLVCAIEEERIRRKKHWAGLPTESVKWCLGYAGVSLKDVDYIAVGRNPYAHLEKKILRVLTKKHSFSFLRSRYKNAGKIKKLKEKLAEDLGFSPRAVKAQTVNVEHHKAHLASSFFVSPFNRAVCVSIDGFGDFVSSMVGLGQGNEIKVEKSVKYPHSLGIFYTAMTQFLGFEKYGDEYKVMGLSAMGKPCYMKEMRKIVRLDKNGLFSLNTDFFVHHTKGVEMTWSEGEPQIGRLYSDNLIKLLGAPRKKSEKITQKYVDLASSMQKIYEETFFHVLNNVYKKYRCDKLCLSGGSIQNSLANGRIFENTDFRDVYIPPAAYDAGTAVGAAFWVFNSVLGGEREYIMDTPYFGPEFSNDGIKLMLNAMGIKYEKLSDGDLFRTVAAHIAEGKIVGWFQGRTEWGPRALGNRSILADPRRGDMRDVLNERIKKRENFRPFAPSVLEDSVEDWFENSYPVPFMEKVYKIRAAKRKRVPAVCHVDGTGRLQSVSRKINPRYYALIREFYKMTRVPMVLNTSFNENEPIVNTPGEAIHCFLRTKMDVLVLNNFLIINHKVSFGGGT